MQLYPVKKSGGLHLAGLGLTVGSLADKRGVKLLKLVVVQNIPKVLHLIFQQGSCIYIQLNFPYLGRVRPKDVHKSEKSIT